MAERNLGPKSRKAITTGPQGQADQAMFERRFRAQHVLSSVGPRGVSDHFILTPVTNPDAARHGHTQQPFIMTESLHIGIQDHGTETVVYDAKTLTDWYV